MDEVLAGTAPLAGTRPGRETGAAEPGRSTSGTTDGTARKK